MGTKRIIGAIALWIWTILQYIVTLLQGAILMEHYRADVVHYTDWTALIVYFTAAVLWTIASARYCRDTL